MELRMSSSLAASVAKNIDDSYQWQWKTLVLKS